MLRLAALLVLASIALRLAAPCAALAGPPTRTDEIVKLIEQLGCSDYAEREAATLRLEEIGLAAVEALRAACRSEDPEVVRRAMEILRKIERKLANDKALAPTLVRLDVKEMPLDSLLEELSRQAGCDVVLGGANAVDLAARKVTLSTGGPVPFWTAVLNVCHAAGLQVAAAGGYSAPGATPYLGQSKPGVRTVRNTNRAIVLEARDPRLPRRPAAVNGAILVEVVPVRRGAEGEAVLQIWPETRLQWQAVTSIKIVKAVDDRGRRLRGEFVPSARPPVAVGGRDEVTIIRNPDGSFTAVLGSSPALHPEGVFVAGPRQAVLRFKGETPPRLVKDLDLVVLATARSGIQPLCQVQGMKENQTITTTGKNMELSAVYRKDTDGKQVASVTLTHDSDIQSVGVGDEIPGVKGAAGLGFGNHTVSGVRVTDKTGKPFDLGLKSGASGSNLRSTRTTTRLTLELVPDRDSTEPPANITFWGTCIETIEVPVHLKDIVLRADKDR